MAVAFTGFGAVAQRANAAGSTNTGDVAPAWPAAPSTLVGQLALVPVELRSTNLSQPAPPAGFAKGTVGANTPGQGFIIWKGIDGTEADPLLISNILPNRGVALASVHVFSGADLTTPFEDIQITSGDTSPAGATTTTATLPGSIHFRAWLRQGGVGNLTPPAGWTETVDFLTGSGDDAGMQFIYQEDPIGQALTDANFSTGSGPWWVKVSGVIRPAASGPMGYASNGASFNQITGIWSVMEPGSFVPATEAHVSDGLGGWTRFL